MNNIEEHDKPAAVVGTQADHWVGGVFGDEVLRWQQTGPLKTVMLLKDLPLGTLLYTRPPMSKTDAS
jgi:hypothetical protein